MVKGSPILLLLGMSAVTVACTGTGDPIDRDTDEGPELVGNIVVDPCTIDFGSVLPGESATQTVRVLNTGAGDLQVTAITTAAPFEAVANPPVLVTETYQFSVTFAPDEGQFGSFTEDLIITSDDPQEPSVVCVVTGAVSDDADNDGFTSVESGGTDCDDLDASINPAADEVWYDGIDQDCAGDSDYDQDGDGYDSQVFWESSDDVNPETGQLGGDCQDVDPTMNPGMEEVWYDGKDADCDGQNDFDRDGDGFRTAEYGFDDCNDDDPLANPLGIEAFNGADDDCNGLVDDKASPERAEKIQYGDDDGYAAGRGIAMVDVDETGTADVFIGVHYALYSKTGTGTGDAQGGIAVYFDDEGLDEDFVGDEADESLWIAGDTSDGELGFEVISLEDFDGEGQADVAATAIGHDGWSGKVYIWDGESFSLTTTAEDAALTITGLRGYKLGGGLGTGDLNGDGLSEIVMFGSDLSKTYTYMGVHYGASDALGAIDWTEIDATFLSKCGDSAIYSWYTASCEGDGFSSWGTAGDAGGGEHFLNNGHAAADVDGDGYDDVLFGDKWDEEGTSRKDQGQAWILWGRRSEYNNSNSNYDDAATKLAVGSSSNANLGAITFMKDVDGDGADEVLVHDDDRSTLYMLRGGTELRSDYRDLEEEADATFRGISEFSGAVEMGDWSGDGVSEVGFAFAGADASGGSFFVLESRVWSGEFAASTNAFGTIEGDEWNNKFGMGLPIKAADLDGDTFTDLVIGDWQYDNEDLTDKGAEGAIFYFYQAGE